MSEGRIEDPVLGPLAPVSGVWEGSVTLPIPGGESVTVSVEREGASGPSDAQREAARYALSLTTEGATRLAETLYADFLRMVDIVGPQDFPSIDAPADVWAHVELIGLAIPEHGGLRRRYFTLQCEVAWEEEHGAEVLFQDGVPVELDFIGSTSLPSGYEEGAA